MPSPYFLHGSGPLACWSAFPGEVALRSIKNRSYFLIVFLIRFGSILISFGDPFGSLFATQIDPSSVQVAFLSFIFFKNMIFTKPIKNQ